MPFKAVDSEAIVERARSTYFPSGAVSLNLSTLITAVIGPEEVGLPKETLTFVTVASAGIVENLAVTGKDHPLPPLSPREGATVLDIDCSP